MEKADYREKSVIPPDSFRISARALGALTLDGFCPRCFWIDSHIGFPPAPFPGIFNSIDSFSKKAIRNYIEKHSKLPEWGQCMGNVTDYLEVKKLRWYDKKSESLLTGVPDEILTLSNGKCIIIDYKTARYTKTQDALLPLYEVQLNVYKFLIEKHDYPKVEALYLVYFEPPEMHSKLSDEANEGGFAMGFSAKTMEITKKIDVLSLLSKAKKLYSGDMPEGLNGCKTCLALKNISEVFVEKQKGSR